jgi:hypothetical protein
MEIAISAPSSAIPRIKQLASILRSFGPSKHPLYVFCTAPFRTEVSRIFEGMNATVVATLSGIIRLPPMSDNEPFAHIMKHMTRTHWFYLPAGTIPVTANWADQLEQEYLASGQQYLGCADYIPHRYRDGSGIDRVVNGAPYILEAAVYPANLSKITKYTPISRIVHHEVARRSEMSPNTHLSSLIRNAQWADGFGLNHMGSSVVATRVLGAELGDAVLKEGYRQMLGVGNPVTYEVPVDHFIEPTKPSPKVEDEVMVIPRRPPGRPRKS